MEKEAKEDLPKGKSSVFIHSPSVPLCTQMFPLWAPSYTGAHWPQTDGTWLVVEQRAGLIGGWLAQSSVGVSLGAVLGGALTLAEFCV